MKILKKLKDIQIKWKHILIIFITLIIFQVFVSHLQQNTLGSLISDTMDWYKQNSAEQIGNLTATSLELLLESDPLEDYTAKEKIMVHGLNSILKQPLMKRDVEGMCVILPYNDSFVAINLGQNLYDYFYSHQVTDTATNNMYRNALIQYSNIHEQMMQAELITSFKEDQIFHVYVPLVPHGEYGGAVYLKIHPDFSFISSQILASFNQTVLIFSSLILIGLLAMFYISAYTILERDKASELLYKEREVHLQEQVAQQKEHLFTKRIYHTHHKAEKIMGFINEDLENIHNEDIKEVKYKISKYANFISRVIYDMKWYNPPINTIRNFIFRTNLNDVLKFIINYIFLRLSYQVKSIKFDFNLDENLPVVQINEFVVWEIIEPLIQNSIDHSGKDVVIITIITRYNPETGNSVLIIEDNGKGIQEGLLEKNEAGVRKIFLENISTKEEDENCGYGCYIAYEISRRCGWELDAGNKPNGGSYFSLLIGN